MVNDNAINTETGETIHVTIYDDIPDGFRSIWSMDIQDWLELIRKLRVKTPA